MPLGKVPETLLDGIRVPIEEIFGWPTIPMEGIGIPPQAFIEKRNQFYSHVLLKAMADARWQSSYPECEKILGITRADLATPVLTFVFGEAQLGGRFGLISLARLGQEFYGQPENENQLLVRTVKEAVHELGHTFGLVHCTFESCVMYFSINIRDVDDKGVDFCSGCWPVLAKKMEVF